MAYNARRGRRGMAGNRARGRRGMTMGGRAGGMRTDRPPVNYQRGGLGARGAVHGRGGKGATGDNGVRGTRRMTGAAGTSRPGVYRENPWGFQHWCKYYPGGGPR